MQQQQQRSRVYILTWPSNLHGGPKKLCATFKHIDLHQYLIQLYSPAINSKKYTTTEADNRETDKILKFYFFVHHVYIWFVRPVMIGLLMGIFILLAEFFCITFLLLLSAFFFARAKPKFVSFRIRNVLQISGDICFDSNSLTHVIMHVIADGTWKQSGPMSASIKKIISVEVKDIKADHSMCMASA